MLSIKRALRIGIPVAVLALGMTMYAQGRSSDCGHPSMWAKALQATGLAQIQPCVVIQSGYGGNFCADVGHHCNVGYGPGKCHNEADPVTEVVTCQCVNK